MRHAGVASILLALLTSAHAGTLMGGDLQMVCKDPRSQALCDAYIGGISDGAAEVMKFYVGTEHQKPVVCPPVDMKNNQVEAIAKKFLDAHPEMLHQSAAVLVIGSLMKTFPCR